jgi:protein-S-isoprenylcysteine O-methyltransferase Ste14
MMHAIRVLAINLILSALAVTAAPLALKADRFWPFAIPEQLELLEWPLLILGTLLILAAEYSLITVGHATGAPGNPSRQLVTTGLYRWVRNPLYLGVALLLFSVAFFNSSPTTLLIAFTFLPAIHAVVVLVEEPRTERRFGPEYVSYKQNVPRWLPRPPKRGNNAID